MRSPEEFDAWMYWSTPSLIRGQRPPDVSPWYERRATKVVFWVVGVLAVGSLGYWIWWGLWHNHQESGSPTPDRWLNVVLGLGAAAAVLAFLGGVYLAARYGRRASISISAEITPLSGGDVLISARPEVTAVGLFKVKFHGTSGAVIRVREVYAVDAAVSPTGLWEGKYRLAAAVFGEDDDNKQFAESGEALKTTVLFRTPAPEGVVGWMVVVSIKAPTRWIPGASGAWGDKVFLTRPKPQEVEAP